LAGPSLTSEGSRGVHAGKKLVFTILIPGVTLVALVLLLRAWAILAGIVTFAWPPMTPIALLYLIAFWRF
jgi:hypothetical protein